MLHTYFESLPAKRIFHQHVEFVQGFNLEFPELRNNFKVGQFPGQCR